MSLERVAAAGSPATFTGSSNSKGGGGITFYFIGCCNSPNLGDEETEDQLNREMRMIYQLQQGRS